MEMGNLKSIMHKSGEITQLVGGVLAFLFFNVKKKKNLGVVACTYDSSVGVGSWRQENSWGSLNNLFGKSQASERH